MRQKRIPYLIPLPIKGKTGGLKALCQGKASYRTVQTFNVGTPHAYTTDVILLCRYRKGRYGRHGCQWFAYAAYGIERVRWRTSFLSIGAASAWRVAIDRCIR